ncbi:uncharacterized protein LOC121404664 [Drosophila obscura]|uniref:uncharacterized protein LOC121404664 n=1 Tax=Drosophila obscura TaxID=7282 RepID=UPI001BB28987|nr:uncharacterized protein LOC121404664 [Drosophila obscura]
MAHKMSSLIHSRVEFTNIKCKSVDNKFGEVDYCYLKSVNRTYKYMSAKYKLYQLPVKALEVNFMLMKRFNGYKPFLYNITLNACKFFVNPKYSPVTKFFYESVVTFTNMNHSCPYNHDIILDKVPIEFINHRFTKILPFPEGDYLIEAYWSSSGSPVAEGKIHSRVEFTNIKCKSVDKKFGDVDYCYLKSFNRTYKYLSAKFKLYQLPVKAIEVNLVLMKRFNGYKPFLYNITVNACKFFVNPKYSPVTKFFYESVVTFTNMNHSCPYNNDIIVDKVPIEFINHRLTQILPFPEGDYLVEAYWSSSGSRFAEGKIHSRVEFTNIKCKSVDNKFGEVDYCYLKSVNRTYKYMSAKYKLYQLPVKALEVNFMLMKRFNGYKPFLYNITVNACKFFVNRNYSPVTKFFYESAVTFTNMNHSCPYNHDIILDKVPIEFINHRLTKILPFPEGDYLIEAYWSSSGSPFAESKLYFTLS